jgi:hypothetical protein
VAPDEDLERPDVAVGRSTSEDGVVEVGEGLVVHAFLLLVWGRGFLSAVPSCR